MTPWRRRCMIPLDTNNLAMLLMLGRRMIWLAFEFTRLRKRAKPAVAGRVQRRVRPRYGTH